MDFFVGDLAGGDGVDLLDVLDLGNGLHGCVFMCVIKVRKRLACPSLKSCGRGKASAAKIFRKGTPSFFLLAPRFFTSTERWLSERKGEKREEKKGRE